MRPAASRSSRRAQRAEPCVSRGAAECPGPPHGGDDRQDDREVAREEHDPFPRPPDRRGPRDGAEAPPPDEEVERRVERPDAEGQEECDRTEEGHCGAPPTGRRTPGAEPPREDRAGAERSPVRQRHDEQRDTERRMKPQAIGRVLGRSPDREPDHAGDRSNGAEREPGGRPAGRPRQPIEAGRTHQPRSRSRSSAPNRQRSCRRRSPSALCAEARTPRPTASSASSARKARSSRPVSTTA